MAQTGVTSRRSLGLGMVSLLALASCGIPRSGPSKSEILDSSTTAWGNINVVMATMGVAKAADYIPPLAFPASFLSAGIVGPDVIHSGDTLGLTVWENVQEGVLGPGHTPMPLNTVQVDGKGNIFVPYAGEVHAAGLTPEQLRKQIVDALQSQTPDPQVMIARQAGNGSTVSVSGSVSQQGVYPIDMSTRTLSSMLARAGGLSITPEIAQVTLLRGSTSGTIWYNDIFSKPGDDIALRPGDRILVQADRRSYTALGATGGQTRINFNSQELTAMEALAQVGGLSGNAADPTGIFVLRNETQAVSRVVLGNPALNGPQQVAYVLNLTTGDGLFVARNFMIRDEDTIYVTEAPFTQFSKVLSAFAGSLQSVSAAQTVGIRSGL